MTILLFALFAQVTFDWKTPIALDIDTVPLEKVTITNESIIIRDESAQVVHVLDKDGRVKVDLGGDDSSQKILVPFYVSWMESAKKLYVYDAGERMFSVWRENGTFIETRKTNFDLFFQVGHLLDFQDGYIAPTSLMGNHLLGKFDANFQVTGTEYELSDHRLADLSPTLRKTYVAKVTTKNGDARLLAVQTLAKRVEVFDGNLNKVRSLTLNTNGWKDHKIKRLAKVSKNPNELRKYQKSYSDIQGLEALYESVFVVGIRNLKGPETYTYQCYNAETGLPVGSAFDSEYKLVGAWEDELYFVNPNFPGMALVPCKIVH